MGWFSRRIDDPNEAWNRLLSSDQKTTKQATQDFVDNLNNDLVDFLAKKYQSSPTTDTRLRILEVFTQGRAKLSAEDLRLIMPLLMATEETVLRESFKEILVDIDERRLAPLTEVLTQTKDVETRRIINHAIERSGIIETFIKKWADYSSKEKILYLGEIVALQNVKTYPIFIEIMKEEVIESRKEEKRIIQVEFQKHLDKIKDPAFMEICLRELPGFDQNMWYPVLKCLQAQGRAFFEALMQGFDRKGETYRLRIIQNLEKLQDPHSYPFLFPYLLDRAKSIPPLIQNTIQGIVKKFAEELEGLDSTKPEVLHQITFFLAPLEERLRDEFSHSLQILAECVLRIGKHYQPAILRNLPKLLKYNETFLFAFLKGLDAKDRKELMIAACCFPQVETGRAALAILNNPTENYIIEILNSLLLEHFMKLPPEIQKDTMKLMMDPRLKRFVQEVLFHQDPALRTRILQILGDSGTPEVLQILLSKVHDPDTSVRIGILKILQSKPYCNDSGTEVLMEFLKDTDAGIVNQTIEILKERNHPKIIAMLSKLLTSNNLQLRQAAHAAIAYVTRRKYTTSFNAMNEQAKYAIGMSLIKMDPTFLEDITRDLSHNDQGVRVLSARILEVLCDHIPPELKTNLIVAIQDPDPQVRAVVIMGLGKIGGPSVANMLVEFLKDQDDRVRANAVEAMANVGDLSLVEVLHPCLYDKNNRVRANAIITLWKLGYYQIYEAITEMLRDPNKWMRASAAFALGELADVRFFPVLCSCLRDPEADVRRNVVKALSKIADPFSLAPYIRPLRFDPDEMVRKEVQAILTAPAKAQQPKQA